MKYHKRETEAIRLADMASIIDCDIYIHSHTHLPMVMKQGFHRIDLQNSTVAKMVLLKTLKRGYKCEQNFL